MYELSKEPTRRLFPMAALPVRVIAAPDSSALDVVPLTDALRQVRRVDVRVPVTDALAPKKMPGLERVPAMDAYGPEQFKTLLRLVPITERFCVTVQYGAYMAVLPSVLPAIVMMDPKLGVRRLTVPMLRQIEPVVNPWLSVRLESMLA